MVQRVDMTPLVVKLRDWLENPKINAVLLKRRIFNSAMEIAKLHEDMHLYGKRGLASIAGRMMGSPHVRRRIAALSPDRRASLVAMDSLAEWAAINSLDPEAKGN